MNIVLFPRNPCYSYDFLFIIIIILEQYTIYKLNNNHKTSLGVIYY